jgi:hypothetical protein
METDQKFIISGTNDILWNYQELTKYLALNQNKHIALLIHPEAIPLQELGVYQLLDNFKFASVDIYTENQLEKHHKYNIIVCVDNTWLANRPSISNNLHTWTGEKTFLIFYHRPTASRLGLASYLYNHYLLQSQIHFNYPTDDNRLALFEFDKLVLLSKNSFVDTAKMLDDMPLVAYKNADPTQVRTNFNYSYNFDGGITQYTKILVDVVSETHVSGLTFYPTEKTARPMWLKKPFIMFASRDYLCYMRQMGFQTFYQFWDEDYDGYEGKERYVRIQKLIDEIGKQTNAQLENMYKSMQPILEHNYNLLKTQSYIKTITLIDDDGE